MQFVFLIGRFLKKNFSETALPKWTEIWWEAPMEGSVLSFFKAEWKVSDTGSAHWASSYRCRLLNSYIVFPVGSIFNALYMYAKFNYCQFLRTKKVVVSCWKNYSVFQKRQSWSDKERLKIQKKRKLKDKQHNFQRKNDMKINHYTEKEPHLIRGELVLLLLKSSDKSWKRKKERDCAYDKRNISVVIMGTVNPSKWRLQLWTWPLCTLNSVAFCQQQHFSKEILIRTTSYGI